LTGQAAGFVSLIGAGPGDPALLTRKAAVRLRSAELVLYDALVDARVLRLARKARRFFVGKRAGRHSLTQDAINALLIRSARRGLRVVRLKGGDPFVFGRGAEEAMALNAAGVRYEFVPGISNAIAAPASAGIPVTHRGTAAAFLVVSGHDRLRFIEATTAIQPNAITVVVLMGVSQRASIADALIARGWRDDTPAAIVLGATTDKAQAWRGGLRELASAPCETALPGTIVIGDVAALDVRSAAGPQIARRSHLVIHPTIAKRRAGADAQPSGARHVSCR
jgi:uroporphyrin-III C-methyltransferase / precorrin-2 dehydrogenase / sirohydrochlorin ferrochelatase